MIRDPEMLEGLLATVRGFVRDRLAFLVPRPTPGLILGPPDRKMGQRGTKTYDVILQDARIPAANVIGGVEGWVSRRR